MIEPAAAALRRVLLFTNRTCPFARRFENNRTSRAAPLLAAAWRAI